MNDAYENGQLVPVTEIDELIYSESPKVYEDEPESKDELAMAALLRLLVVIIDADKPRLTAYQIADSLNALSLIGGITGTEIAKRFGVSKQDYEQGRDRVAEKLCVSFQTRRMKCAKASKSYSLSNYRKPKNKI